MSAGQPRDATIGRMFLAFLLIGATSFGGGVVAHLRSGLVTKHRWMEDKAFLELLAISQTLPGLKATNLAILAGDRLRGPLGALAAIVGVCLPGAVVMYFVGMVYGVESERPLVVAGLEGVAAAAVGLLLATTVQIGPAVALPRVRPGLHPGHDHRRQPPARVRTARADRGRSARRFLVPTPRRIAAGLAAMNQIPVLVSVFTSLALLTWGGGIAAFPELKAQAVDVHQWLTFPELDYLYSLGQMVPGPAMMTIVPIGGRVAGVCGALAVLLAFFGPTGLIAFVVGRLWIKLQRWPWMASIRRGLAPVSIGLLLAGCITFARGAVTGWTTAMIALAVFVAVLCSRINLALLVLGGAAVGLFAFGRGG
jgi:chromate transporter